MGTPEREADGTKLRSGTMIVAVIVVAGMITVVLALIFATKSRPPVQLEPTPSVGSPASPTGSAGNG